MSNLFSIQELLTHSNPIEFVINGTYYDEIKRESSIKLLDQILKAIPKIKRFQSEVELDKWNLQIALTDDEGIEFSILHSTIELICFLLEDDQIFSDEIISRNFSLDNVYIPKYQEFLKNDDLKRMLIEEVNLWLDDSYLHPNAYSHLQAVLERGFNLATFEGDENIQVEFSFDQDEIFIATINEDDGPDYQLIHDQFNPKSPEESINIGIQSWANIDEEDDDWDDLEDFDEDIEEEDDDWDHEGEEWEPRITEEGS